LDLVLDGIIKAFRLISGLDPEVVAITLLTLKISGTATAVSTGIGILSGTVIALVRFPGRRFVVAMVNTGMGLPPVVVGLFITILIWRSGPLGSLGLLYTPAAMVIAQTIIATPIITGITLSAMQHLPEKLRLQILALGATRIQMLLLLMREARLPVLTGIMAGFGGVVSEIGASIMVGGNVRGYTRVLTTATVMETGKGNFALAISLGVILLVLAFAVNYTLTTIQQRTTP
jgi:tungstate transport system permease protein